MKILVTGSSGFLAGYLINKLLKEQHEVIGIDIKLNTNFAQYNNYKEFKVNLINKKEINDFFHSQESFNVVVHTAAYTTYNSR